MKTPTLLFGLALFLTGCAGTVVVDDGPRRYHRSSAVIVVDDGPRHHHRSEPRRYHHR